MGSDFWLRLQTYNIAYAVLLMSFQMCLSFKSVILGQLGGMVQLKDMNVAVCYSHGWLTRLKHRVNKARVKKLIPFAV